MDFTETDEKLGRLAKQMDNIRKINFTVDLLEHLFPSGYHIMDVTWRNDDIYEVDQMVSRGYQQAYEYTEEELPLTMASKYSIAEKEEVDESNLNLDETIRTGEPTDGYVNVRHKSGIRVKYYYRNAVMGTENGKTKTIFGYQVKC